MLEEYRRRIIMMVSEGSVLCIASPGADRRCSGEVFDREVELERQAPELPFRHHPRAQVAASRHAPGARDRDRWERASGDTAKRFLGNALDDTLTVWRIWCRRSSRQPDIGDNWSEIDLRDTSISAASSKNRSQVFSPTRPGQPGCYLEARIAT